MLVWALITVTVLITTYGEELRAVSGGGSGPLPPATVLVRAHYPGVYRGSGPPLLVGLRTGVGRGAVVGLVEARGALLVTIRGRFRVQPWR
jgi:hypothetical protein